MLRAVADFNVFDIGILEIVFCFFIFILILCLSASITSVDLFCCHSSISQAQLQYQTISI